MALHADGLGYQVISKQIKDDKRVRDLRDGLVEVFKHIQEFNGLNLQSRLGSLNDAICSLLDLLTRICVFVREYLRLNFLGEHLFNLDPNTC